MARSKKPFKFAGVCPACNQQVEYKMNFGLVFHVNLQNIQCEDSKDGRRIPRMPRQNMVYPVNTDYVRSEEVETSI